MKPFFAVCFLLTLLPLCGGEKARLAEEYLVAKGTPELMEATVSGMVNKQLQENPELLPYRMAVLEYCRNSLSFETHKQELIAMYTESFSVEELQELIRIARSPLGKKLAVFERELSSKLSSLIDRKLAENMPAFQKKIAELTPQ